VLRKGLIVAVFIICVSVITIPAYAQEFTDKEPTLVEINSVTKISESEFQIEVINHKDFPVGNVKIWAAIYEGETILETLIGVFDLLPPFESAQGIIQFTKTGDNTDFVLLGFNSAPLPNDFSKTNFIQGESVIHPDVPVPEPEDNDLRNQIAELKLEIKELKMQIDELNQNLENLNQIILGQLKVIYDWVISR